MSIERGWEARLDSRQRGVGTIKSTEVCKTESTKIVILGRGVPPGSRGTTRPGDPAFCFFVCIPSFALAKRAGMIGKGVRGKKF